MRLEVEGRKVQVYFQYGTSALHMQYGAWEDLKPEEQKVEVPSITCVIREAPPVGPDGKTIPGSDTPIIATATAICGPEDRDRKKYDKVFGRWIAFRRALSPLPRSQRKALGDWYRSSCKIPRNAKLAGV